MSFESSVYNSNPYYDDFDPSKKYLRILFRPGYSVQARELTQLQTLLHNQIKSFGEHIFEPGSLVSGGQISESALNYVRVDQTNISKSTDGGSNYSTITTSADITAAYTAAIGSEFGIGNGSYNSGVGRVVQSMEQDDDTVDTYGYLFFNYLRGDSTVSSNNILELEAENGDRYRFRAKVTGDDLPVTGRGRLVTTQPGLYFVDGSFVITTEQKTVPYTLSTSSLNTDGGETVAIGGKMFTSPTARVGFTVTDTIVTSDDDSTLLDPANGFSNFTAPGADRLQKNLTLSSQSFISDTTTSIDRYASNGFFEILRYEDGIAIRKEVLPDYSVLEDTLARRTFEESGNYTTSDFNLQTFEHLNDGTNEGIYTIGNGGDEAKLVGVLEPGKAYILGREFETISRTFLDINKARTTDEEDDKIVDVNIGNYVIIGASAGGGAANGFGAGVGFIDSQDHPLMILGNSLGISLGTARFRQLDVENAATDEYRMYLYDVEMISGADFANTEILFASTGATMGIISPTNGVDASGNTIQYVPTNDSLVIPLPFNAATQTVDNIDFDVQLSFSQSAAGGQIQVSVPAKSGDPITFPGDVNAVVATSLLNNRYFLINVTDNAYIEDFTGIVFTTSSDNETLTITGLTNGKTYRVLANCEVNTTDVSFFNRTKVLASTETVAGVTMGVDIFSGITFGNLGVADIYAIESIVGDTDAPGIDFTDRFDLDDGQRDNFYDHGRILLAAGATPGDSSFTVSYRRFTHSGDGPFVVDSYPVGTQYGGITFGYENIPSFTSNKTGTVYSLRDVLDFRPVKAADGTLSNTWIPVAKESMTASFKYYLPRIDRVVITKDREFKVIEGLPSLSPKTPDIPSDSLNLYTMRLGSYTFGPSDVEVQHHETKRFTMEDIGQIEKRVDDLEYFSSLSFLEQDANSRTFVTDANVIIPKVGIVVDNFNGHEIGDVNNKDYNCAMDFENGMLRPAFDTQIVPLIEDVRDFNISQRDGIYTLDYTEQLAIANPLAETTTKVNPTDRVDWYGSVTLSEYSDYWYSEEKRAGVRSNKYGVNDAWEYRNGSRSDSPYGFGTQWGDWTYNWFGIPSTDFEIAPQDLNSNSRVFDTTFSGLSDSVRNKNFDFLLNNQISSKSISSSARTNIANNSTPDSIFNRILNRRYNTSIQPYNRLKSITFTAEGLKPRTTMYIFVDNMSVGSVTSDTKGIATGSINLDAGDIRSGDLLIRLIDDSSNNIANATTVAETIYRISGFGRDKDIISTRPSIPRRSSINSSNVSSSVFSRTLADGSSANSLDAMAQNFTVDKVKYNKGMFVNSLDLVFAAKPGTSQTDIPVSVEIRPTVSGYPHPSKVIPGSIVYKYASEITPVTSDDFSTASTSDLTILTQNNTRFTFDHPVYLEPGEYSIVVRTNSDEYTLYTSVTGNSLTGSENVSSQPFVGNFFRPQNAGTYIVDKTRSLTFGLNRCKFDSSGTVGFKNGPIMMDFTYDAYYIHSGQLDFGRNGTSQQLSFTVQTTDSGGSLESSGSPVSVNQTVFPLDSRGTQVVKSITKSFVLNATLTTDDDAVSPVIDLQRLGVVAIQNDVRDSSSTTSNRQDVQYNGELDPSILENVSSALVSKSRYITKSIVLEEGVSASDIRVIMDVNQPSVTDIQVFVKALSDTDTVDLNGKDYVELTPGTSVVSNNGDEYTEVEYSIADPSVLGSFDVFVVKIVMHTSNQFVVPSVKDMRVIALA